MSRRGTVASFPPAVRRMVERKLTENGFCDYVRLAAELTAAGHPVTKSALHRFGAQLRETTGKAVAQAVIRQRAIELIEQRQQRPGATEAELVNELRTLLSGAGHQAEQMQAAEESARSLLSHASKAHKEAAKKTEVHEFSKQPDQVTQVTK